MDVELYSWLFLHSVWPKLNRMPVPDRGFEDEFRNYLYQKIGFDTASGKRDMGLGLSHVSLSGSPHELDVVFTQGKQMFVFELKHYEALSLSKEVFLPSWGRSLIST